MADQENFKNKSMEELKKKNPSAAKILNSFENLGKAILPGEEESEPKKDPIARKHYGPGMSPIEFERLQKEHESVGKRERDEESGGRD